MGKEWHPCSSKEEEYMILTYIPESESESESDDNEYTYGMIEVFRVKINRKGTLSGVIFINNLSTGLTDVVFNNEGRREFRIRGEDGGDVLLHGPEHNSCSSGTSLLFFDLVHTSTGPGGGEEKHLITQLHGLDFDCVTLKHNKPLHRKVVGDDGALTATITLCAFSCAYKASPQISLIHGRGGDGDGDDHPLIRVSGFIGASNDMMIPAPAVGYTSCDYECILFHNYEDAEDDCLQLKPGDLIPLCRPTVATPLYHHLTLRLNLLLRSSNSTYACRTKLLFPAKPSGISQMEIDGKILVKITWSNKYY